MVKLTPGGLVWRLVSWLLLVQGADEQHVQ